jgi:predicted methyltransferase
LHGLAFYFIPYALSFMKYFSFFLLLCIIPIVTFAQDPWKDIYRESAWEQRDTWQRANAIIQELNVKIGSHVADVGCHEGYFTIKLSHVVGKGGKVYAVDISRDKIEKLKNILRIGKSRMWRQLSAKKIIHTFLRLL